MSSSANDEQTPFEGRVPTKEQARKVFWKLGEQWWKPFIDGKWHDLGPEVFDRGLHEGQEELGYLGSLHNGCVFVSDYLGSPLTLDFYKELQRKTCAHHWEMCIRVPSTVEPFSIRAISYTQNIFALGDTKAIEGYFFSKIYDPAISESNDLSEEEKNEAYRKAGINRIKELEPLPEISSNLVQKLYDKLLLNEKSINQKISSCYTPSLNCQSPCFKSVRERIERVKRYSDNVTEQLGFAPFIEISFLDPGCVHIKYLKSPLYNGLTVGQMDEIVETLFIRYNERIKEINIKMAANSSRTEEFQEEKIKAIANLFQLLEWLHPFYDGQGRTDLVVLAK